MSPRNLVFSLHLLIHSPDRCALLSCQAPQISGPIHGFVTNAVTQDSTNFLCNSDNSQLCGCPVSAWTPGSSAFGGKAAQTAQSEWAQLCARTTFSKDTEISISVLFTCHKILFSSCCSSNHGKNTLSSRVIQNRPTGLILKGKFIKPGVSYDDPESN